jgi:hypothetical protein
LVRKGSEKQIQNFIFHFLVRFDLVNFRCAANTFNANLLDPIAVHPILKGFSLASKNHLRYIKIFKLITRR